MLDLLVETFRINQREQRTVRATSRHPCISLVDFPVFTTNYSLTVGELTVLYSHGQFGERYRHV